MQLTYYSGLIFCVLIVDAAFGYRPHSAQVFSSRVFADSAGKYWYASIIAYWLNIPL